MESHDQPCLVQYGCGHSAPNGWINFDSSPTLRFERIPLLGRLYKKNQERFPASVRYGDIVRGLPMADESCDAVYCSHVLEHLALDDLRVALRNTLRIMRGQAVFRLVLPDLEACARNYLENPGADAAPEFMRATSLGWPERDRSLKGGLLEWLGNSRHLWMWDFPSLKQELAEAGFHRIRRAQIGDSELPEFDAVEDPSRWTGQLGIECRRPIEK